MKQKDRSPSQILQQGDDSIRASDASDNLTTLRGTIFAYNFDNQFSSGATYDGQGNPTTYNWGGTATPLVWTAEDRLAQFGTSPNTNEFTAGYRPDGLRAWKQVGTASTARTYFLYDSGHVFAELDSTGALTSAYGWGAAGLVERRAVSSSLTYGYTFDTTGSVIQRHHIGGATYADYATCYDAFGGQLGSYNNGGFVANTQDAVGWSGQFGGYTDQETVTPPGAGTDPLKRFPLVLLGHRYYDPGAGRFLNRDPEGMEGGVNVYAYCRNNPINRADPSGLDGVTLLTPEDMAAFYGAIDFSIENRAAISETGFAVAKGAATIAGASGTLATASALLGTGAAATALAATGVVAVGAVGAYVGYNYVGVPLANSLFGPDTLPTMAADPAIAQLYKRAKAKQKIVEKLQYMFGKATGAQHNLDRSAEMYQSLKKIGIFDTPKNRRYLTQYLLGVMSNPSNIEKIQPNGSIVRDSLLMGPRGGVKLQTIWRGNMLLTFNIFRQK